MRTLTLAAFVFIPVLALGACASSGVERSTASGDDLSRIRSECDARGGVVVPTGRITAQPQLDNVCRIDGASAPAPLPN